ncbi:MAG: FkbM family methyltransferase, partial [Rhodospirillaceae bacterium]|nr:FkbM family methyltransferase [Rhodospirillaceae bacterium]
MADREKAAIEAAAAAVRRLPVKSRNRLLFDLLAEAGATGIVIPGANGEIEGAIADRTVILKYLKNKSWSVEAVRLMQAVYAAQGPGSWIDLGANIGAMTIPAALAGAKCHAVEPEPSNLALLRRNIARNGVADRVTVHEAAAWHEAAELAFEIAPANLGDHRVRTAAPGSNDAYGEAARTTVTVPARPVDALIDAGSLAGPVLVKVDVQGAEGHALAGGAALFGRADLALMEYWPYGLRRLGTEPAALFAAVAGHFP